MAWFDGTFETKIQELEEEFPVVISENLRMNAEKNKIAVINDFMKDSALCKLSDPHLENGVYHSTVFFHLFLGADACKAKEAINAFIAEGYGKGEYDISLYRKEDNRLFLYSYGELHPEITLPDEKIKCCIDTLNSDYFVLPLKAYAFKCPVCGERTLQFRGMFYICRFCDWEDEGIDDEDEVPAFGANGDYSIRQYREEYKRQLSMEYNLPFEELTEEQRMLSSLD